MSLLQRTFTSLYAKIDNLVGEIENHDALIKAAIGEQKQKLAAAKLEMRRLNGHLFNVKADIRKAEESANLWTERALKEAAKDENKALLCLQRKHSVAEKAEKLQSMQKEYEQTLKKMQTNISRCESDLQAMMQKHQMLKARQCTSDAMQCIDKYHSGNSEALSDSFDRWELRIAQHEIGEISVCDDDPLEQAYIEKENETDLRYELAELLKNNSVTK